MALAKARVTRIFIQNKMIIISKAQFFTKKNRYHMNKFNLKCQNETQKYSYPALACRLP